MLFLYHTQLLSTLLFIIDMGTAERDDTREIVSPEQPAINTTRLLNTYLNETDVVLHIGDIAYALGYAATVSVCYSMLFVCDFF